MIQHFTTDVSSEVFFGYFDDQELFIPILQFYVMYDSILILAEAKPDLLASNFVPRSLEFSSLAALGLEPMLEITIPTLFLLF